MSEVHATVVVKSLVLYDTGAGKSVPGGAVSCGAERANWLVAGGRSGWLMVQCWCHDMCLSRAVKARQFLHRCELELHVRTVRSCCGSSYIEHPADVAGFSDNTATAPGLM